MLLEPESRDVESTTDSSERETPSAVERRTEEIHIRNFDFSRTYDLTVEVYDADGLVFASRYYLTPGKTVSERGRLPPGEYEIRVELDGRRERRLHCEIDDTPDKTALVEIGNGTVSVTEGLYT